MRSLPVQNGSIRIASVTGELKHVAVSGLAKARLLWLFRNFYILDFPVLSKKQQQMIERMWHTGLSADAAAVSQYPIGIVEGFSPRLHSSPVAATPVAATPVPAMPVAAMPVSAIPVSVPATPIPATRSHRRLPRLGLSSLARGPVILTAAAGLLLGCVTALSPTHRWMGQSPAAVAAHTGNNDAARDEAARDDAARNEAARNEAARDDAENRVSAALAPLDQTSAVPAAEPAPLAANSPAANDADSPVAGGPEASSSPSFHLPDAMAHNVASPEAMPPHSSGTLSARRAPGKPEVMIRVRVDSQGRPQAFRIMRGNQSRSSAALNAARRWPFQPCAHGGDCEHLLKFTDYGDASSVQIID